MRSEVASVVTHVSGCGNAIVDGREKNQWSKSMIDHDCRGFSEQRMTVNQNATGSSPVGGVAMLIM